MREKTGKPAPRDRYAQRWMALPATEGGWGGAEAEILDDGLVVACYRRDYPGEPPFEPFRQPGGEAWRHYALISPHHEEAAVIDLASGEVIAREDPDAPGWGFCPVGFYVPDWHDVRDGAALPGSSPGQDAGQWPDGALGFTWGCYWGDDNGWKVQALDLSRITGGVLARDDRFGYLRLDTRGDPRDFIRVRPGHGGQGPAVTFTVPRYYEVTGRLLDDGTRD